MMTDIKKRLNPVGQNIVRTLKRTVNVFWSHEVSSARLTVPGLLFLAALYFSFSDWWLVSSLSRLLVFGSAIWFLHRVVRLNFPAVYRQSSAFIGLGLAALTLLFAFMGVRAEDKPILSNGSEPVASLNFLEAQSRYLYEAFQALFLNMNVHADSPAPIAVMLARVFAVLFVTFIAYQTMVRFCTSAISQVKLVYYRLCWVDRPQLVFGLGFVGMQIVRDLRKLRKHVIVVERDPNNSNIEMARDLGGGRPACRCLASRSAARHSIFCRRRHFRGLGFGRIERPRGDFS